MGKTVDTRVFEILRKNFRLHFGDGWDPLKLAYDPERKEWTHPGTVPGTVHYFTEAELLRMYQEEYHDEFDGYLSAVERSEEAANGHETE